jgi:hypothetical protein
MDQNAQEYRYGPDARRRAALLLALSVAMSVGFIAVLAVRRTEFGAFTQAIAVVLLLSLLFTMRAQLARITYRCRILPDQVQVIAPLNRRSIPWATIVEVRRMSLPQTGKQGGWACAVFTRSRRGTSLPTYLFDHQLVRAEDALRQIVLHTPHARHTNI